MTQGLKNKFVLHHPESDSYMYAHSEDERDVLLADGLVEDVTGIKDHEDKAELQLGPWKIDANEEADTRLVMASGEIHTSEGVLIITNDAMVEIPQHIYQAHKGEIDGLEEEANRRFGQPHYGHHEDLEDEAGGPGNINPVSGV